ncbi:MAG: DUF2066 domain-containing protein [Gammaproteobacteria bacterium]|nr:DUF2066 domain-containing protein [Gammaproteobacteria bacterium]NNC77494.1 DUF2066 domain-containing protein [Woeseiaceae bacterium]
MKKIILLALVSIMTLSPALAVEVPTLYTAQVPLDDRRSDPRAHAYDTALAQVLLRVSGSELVNDVTLFDTLFPEPAAYVVQFRAGPNDTLFVSFDGKAIEDTLRRAGQRVWGGDRPLTMVWLAVDWGGGRREIVAAEESADDSDRARSIDRNRRIRERVLDVAANLGLPVAFPLLDGEDLAAVSFSDISGGFDDRVLSASRRYDANSVLIGRLRVSGGSQYQWRYHFGTDQRTFSGEPEVVLSQVYDLLAREFAIGGDDPVRAVRLNVSGIASVDDFGRVERLLADMNHVENYALTEVAGDRASYRVLAHGGATRLARALRFAGLVEQERIDMSGLERLPRGNEQPISSLEFFLNP